jgi:hypothetical protein
MPEVVDLRGRELTVSVPPVLSDPTGKRARLLAGGGRVVALLAVLWVAGLVLAGLGVLPAGDVPLGHAVAAPQAPSGLRHLPRPIPPTAQDLSPAAPVGSNTAVAGGNGHGSESMGQATTAQASTLSAAGQTASAPGSSGAQKTLSAGKASGVPIGTGLVNTTDRAHAGGAAAPGQQKTTTALGNSGTSPGLVRQAVTSTGKFGTTPGHTAGMAGSGHAPIP